MQKQNIFHKNLNIYNVLLDSKHNIKLCSFGWTEPNIKDRANEYIDFIAPEILLNKPFHYKSDIWSLGIVIFFMMFKKLPFKGDSIKEKLNNMIYCNISDLFESAFFEEETKKEGLEKDVFSPELKF